MEQMDATQVLLEWLAVFMRRSLHDMLQFNKVAGLSLAQMNILMWLHYHKPCEVTHLADIMQVSPAAASQMVERMVQQDLVQRVESPADRRTRQVHLTSQGKQLVEETIAARQKWIEDLVTTLDDQQKSAVVELLGGLIEKAKSME
jgi:MarR family transcriptional regulator, organic hydroperoxide resistance regulator